MAIDCSWERVEDVFKKRFRGNNRRLPLLLAGNPTSYSKLGRLSSLEAFAAALMITGFPTIAERLLSLYKWGHTFTLLNKELLDRYVRCTSDEEVKEVEETFFS